MCCISKCESFALAFHHFTCKFTCNYRIENAYLTRNRLPSKTLRADSAVLVLPLWYFET